MASARGNSRDNRGRAVPAGGKGEDDGGWKGREKNSRPGVTTDRATSFTRVLIPHLLQRTPVRTHFKIHWAGVSLQGARAATHTHTYTHTQKYTVCTQSAEPRALPREHTRTHATGRRKQTAHTRCWARLQTLFSPSHVRARSAPAPVPVRASSRARAPPPSQPLRGPSRS